MSPIPVPGAAAGPAAGPWQTFLNLGGLAGALSLLWQVAGAARSRYRSGRLRIQPFRAERDLLPAVRMEGEDRRYITVLVSNVGRRFARGCVARAEAVPLQGNSLGKAVPLHWADTPVTYSTTGAPSTVDIAPGGVHRLDVAFAQSSREPAWLASSSALHGNYFDDAELAPGPYRVEVRVTFDDGNQAACRLLLTSSAAWRELTAAQE